MSQCHHRFWQRHRSFPDSAWERRKSKQCIQFSPSYWLFLLIGGASVGKLNFLADLGNRSVKTKTYCLNSPIYLRNCINEIRSTEFASVVAILPWCAKSQKRS